jgi:hypothetical protein
MALTIGVVVRLTRRLRRVFREGTGVAKPALIIVWLAAGGGMVATSLYMGSAGIDAYSGTVASAQATSGDGLRVHLLGSSFDFFFSDISYEQLPDIRVGDQVEILVQDQVSVNDKVGAPVLSVVAAESARGTWTDSIFGHVVAPFTPSTWPLHEAIRWLLLAFGVGLAAVGVASLLQWIPRRPASSGIVLERPVPESSSGAFSAAMSPAPKRPDKDSKLTNPVPAAPEEARAGAQRRGAGITIGWLTVAIPAIVDLMVIVVGGSNACGPRPNPVGGWGPVVLVLVPIAFAGAGVTTLVLASRDRALSGGSQSGPRALAVIAIALAVTSVPVNFMAFLSWVLCF